MALSDLFAANVLVRWLRGDPGRYDLLTQMVGVKLGDRLLASGAGDPGLVTSLAKVTGLSGRAAAHATSPDDAALLESAAEHAGVLLEVTTSPDATWPYGDGEFDLVVVDAASSEPAAVLPEARRVLRHGGRVVLVVREKATSAPAVDAVHRATFQYFKGARVLFQRDGYALVEALKGQS